MYNCAGNGFMLKGVRELKNRVQCQSTSSCCRCMKVVTFIVVASYLTYTVYPSYPLLTQEFINMGRKLLNRTKIKDLIQL